MASARVLQRLTERAKQAEEIITQLKTQIEAAKQSAAFSVSKPEEDRLRAENAALRAEVGRLKTKLIYAEIQNGVKQYLVPSRKIAQPVSDERKVAEPSQPKKKAPAADKLQKQQKEQAAKKSDEGEPKPKKGKGEKSTADGAPEKMDISRLSLKVGQIVGVKKHPDADSLYVEEVDLGEGQTRTIVSGLVKHVPIEEMQDRLAVFMCNLKPAKMRGIMSQGMIMCASGPDRIEILLPPPGSKIGDIVRTKDYPGEPDALLNPKKKIWETIKPSLRTNAEKVAAYKGSPLYIEGKGEVVAPTLADTQIS